MARLPSVKATAPASASKPKLGKLFAAAAGGDGAIGDDGEAAGLLAAGAQQTHQRGVVDGGQGVGQGGERGDPAGGGGLRGGGDGFAVLVAGLAEGGAHVDQARAEDRAVLGNHRRTVRSAEARAEIGDPPVRGPADRRAGRCLMPGPAGGRR